MEDHYEIAKRRVKMKKGFWSHFSTWAVMTAFFFIFNMITSPGVHWWIFPVLSWGVAVAIHFVNAYGFFRSDSWEKKELEKEMRKLYETEGGVDSAELDLDDIPNRERYAEDNFDDLKKKWDNKDFV